MLPRSAWHEVCENCCGESRIYWHNPVTDDVSWENPLVALAQRSQEVAGEVLTGVRHAALARACAIGRYHRYAIVFARWRAWQPVFVPRMAGILDAWMRLRQVLANVLARRAEEHDALLERVAILHVHNETLRNDLDRSVREHTDVAQHLAELQVRHAAAAYAELRAQARCALPPPPPPLPPPLSPPLPPRAAAGATGVFFGRQRLQAEAVR